MSQVSLEEAYRQIARYRRLANWRTAKGEFPEAKGAEFDDSSWDEFSPGYGWNRKEGERWFRREIVIPEEIHGVPVEGSRVDVRLVLLAGAELFIDGKLVAWEIKPKLPRATGDELGLGSAGMELDDLRISNTVRYRVPLRLDGPRRNESFIGGVGRE